MMDRHDDDWLIFFGIVLGAPIVVTFLSWLVYL